MIKFKQIWNSFSLLDFANLMSYNFYGPWSNYTGQNSALFESKIESRYEKMYLNVAAAAKNWINAGIESEKLSVGLAFYGRSFTLKTPDNFALHAPIIRDGSANRVKTPSYFFVRVTQELKIRFVYFFKNFADLPKVF